MLGYSTHGLAIGSNEDEMVGDFTFILWTLQQVLHCSSVRFLDSPPLPPPNEIFENIVLYCTYTNFHFPATPG
jgi:hypothetical protein